MAGLLHGGVWIDSEADVSGQLAEIEQRLAAQMGNVDSALPCPVCRAPVERRLLPQAKTTQEARVKRIKLFSAFFLFSGGFFACPKALACHLRCASWVFRKERIGTSNHC